MIVQIPNTHSGGMYISHGVLYLYEYFQNIFRGYPIRFQIFFTCENSYFLSYGFWHNVTNKLIVIVIHCRNRFNSLLWQRFVNEHGNFLFLGCNINTGFVNFQNIVAKLIDISLASIRYGGKLSYLFFSYPR